MYHLTCPSCEQVADSPFVRTGAVVRCASCGHKFRVKGSHVERVVLTGPRTVAESDSVLQSDSVDIEPDEMSPVSIDDEGNVVGLSGLSELMRVSDSQNKPASPAADPQPILQARVEREQSSPPPARSARRDSGRETARSAAVRRKRRAAERRKKQMPMLILAGVFGVLLGGGLVVLLIQSGGEDTDPTNPIAEADSVEPTNTDALWPSPPIDGVDSDPLDTDATSTDSKNQLAGIRPLDPDRNPADSPDHAANNPDASDAIVGVDTGATGSPNGETPALNPDAPNNKPDSGKLVIGPDGLPAGFPDTVVKAERVVHEGWYLLDPPRAMVPLRTDPEVKLVDPFRPSPLNQEDVLLSARIKNQSDQSLVKGELHLMLLDNRDMVFAETYLPLSLIKPNGERAVSIKLGGRQWLQARSSRIEVRTIERASDMIAMPRVAARFVLNERYGPTVRVSAQHQGEQTLRGATIRVQANTTKGGVLGEYVVERSDLVIEPGGWLDVAIATPIDKTLLQGEVASWSAEVYMKK